MWPYWIMFAVPACAALFSSGDTFNDRKRFAYPAWIAVSVVIASLVGFRLEVGGDWPSYLVYLENVRGLSFSEVFALSDPGYQLVNWISDQLNMGIFGTNFLCGSLFAWGLVRFCRSLPRPWLALTVAVPYLLIVVAMGYSRQGVALGVAMLGLVAFRRGSYYQFVIWVLVGATFHKSAVLLIPIAVLPRLRHLHWSALPLVVLSLVGYFVFLNNSAEDLYTNYVEAEFQSQGAAVRLAMNALPALILLYLWKRARLASAVDPLWWWFAVLSLGLLVLLFVINASTAIDRVALYMLPLQLVVFSHLPGILVKGSGRGKQLWILLIVFYYFVVQFVWLNFGIHAPLWLPYRFYPLDGVF